MSRRGFTLIEVTVALVIGGMALSAAAALLSGLSSRAEQIRSAGARVDRDANAERLLRNLLANLRASGDSTLTVRGDSGSVTLQAWCATVEGWLRPCRARLGLERDSTSVEFRLELTGGGAENRSVVFRQGARVPAGLRYLRDAAGGGTWVSRWTEVVAPSAISVFAGADTLVLLTW
jgi:prepilin-type N-terminal cleavage/methylation domain-containing protein